MGRCVALTRVSMLFLICDTHIVNFQAFDKAGLRVEFSPTKPDPSDPSKSTIRASFSNTSSEVRLTTHLHKVACQGSQPICHVPKDTETQQAGPIVAVCWLRRSRVASHPAQGSPELVLLKSRLHLQFTSRVSCWLPEKSSIEHLLSRTSSSPPTI